MIMRSKALKLGQVVNKFVYIRILYRHISLCTLRSGNTGSLTFSHATCLNAQRSKGGLVGTDAATGNEKVREPLGDKCTIRHISGFLQECNILLGTGSNVYVNRVSTARDAVRIMICVYILFGCYRVNTFDAACLTDTSMHRDGCYIAILEFLKVFFEHFCHLIYIFAKATFRRGEISIVNSITRCTSHIDCNLARLESSAEPRTAEFRNTEFFFHSKKFLAHREAVAVLSLFVMVHCINQHSPTLTQKTFFNNFSGHSAS